jgi:hypothetical protein
MVKKGPQHGNKMLKDLGFFVDQIQAPISFLLIGRPQHSTIELEDFANSFTKFHVTSSYTTEHVLFGGSCLVHRHNYGVPHFLSTMSHMS